MAKSFFFAIFSIAQAFCGRLDELNNQLELTDRRSLAYGPFLSCVLFGVSACSETCSLIGSIYGHPLTSGICAELNECMCNVLPKASLDDYWNKKFDSDSTNVLGEIRKDGALSKKVLAVLKTPLQTYQETISALKPLLKEKQLKNLHPKDKDAQNIFGADDKFKAVENYVAKNLQSEISADGNDTKKYLNSVIRKADGGYFNRIYEEVCRSQNGLLIEALSTDSTACSRKEDEGNVVRLIDVATVNKLIKLPSNEPSNQSDSSTSSNVKDVWWKLRGLEKSEVEELNLGGKNWDVNGYYHVILKKTNSGLSLTWYNKKYGVDIIMKNVYDDGITQQWYFPNALVELSRKMDGTKTQKWAFKNSTYRVTIDSKGKIQRAEWEGKEKKDLIKRYKKRINTWCAENGYIIGKDNCIIY